MSISLYKIKKWTNMLRGKSVHHVLQDEGKLYSKTEIEGYYNNLTEKISRFGREDNSVPKSRVDSGEEMYFPVAIFQYGLAAYDLYLKDNDKNMLEKVVSCADWAVDNQQSNGGWITFAFVNAEKPYSSMAQGEAVSLLIRAYIATGEQKYMDCAERAKDFMLKPIEQGGTTRYEGEGICFLEHTYGPLVLNGWIFSLWGIWDYYTFTKDENIKKVLDATLKTLEKKLQYFDNGYWSKYDIEKRIASPFYHKLHIAQLNVMYDLTGREIYKYYSEKWLGYSNRFINKKLAFIKKAWQKVVE